MLSIESLQKRSKGPWVLSSLNASYEDQDSHERIQTPGRSSNGLGVLCAVALQSILTRKKNGLQEEHTQIAVESEDAQIAVDIKTEI
ncbi:hypothetical protein PoB_006180100 [Plakobranchus ocellatus]|uniref:Uncharacterized protein n=1 Tax=Plakobranchus ocellatus TaxID=259542 RepID=A0AAV4CUB0_9GAST|nr:hypothetical protein PoB_006180100 [Plakobranchus ocellatus]